MYVYIYIHTYKCKRIYRSIYIYTYINTCDIYIHLGIYMMHLTRARAHTHTNTPTHTRIHTHIHTHARTHTQTNMHTHAYTRTHTLAHTHAAVLCVYGYIYLRTVTLRVWVCTHTHTNQWPALSLLMMWSCALILSTSCMTAVLKVPCKKHVCVCTRVWMFVVHACGSDYCGICLDIFGGKSRLDNDDKSLPILQMICICVWIYACTSNGIDVCSEFWYSMCVWVTFVIYFNWPFIVWTLITHG